MTRYSSLVTCHASRLTRHAILALTLLAFLLRVYRLDQHSYWIDEGWTLFYAHLSLPELWHYLQTIRAAPPLYHLLTIYWVQLVGDGEFALRFLSAGFSVMAVPLTYRLAKTLGGHHLGLMAALLMAVSPYQIWHAQDARNYSLLTAASVLSMWSFVSLWRRGTWRWWLLYLSGTFVAMMTHYHGLMIIGVQGLFFLITARRHWRYYLTWGAALLLILLPLGLWLTLGSTLWQAEHWLPLVGLWESYWRGATAYSIGELAPPPLAVYLALAFVVLYLLGLIAAARRPWPPWAGWEMTAFLLCYTLAPNLAAWFYSQWQTPVYLERYLIVVQPGFLMAIAVAMLAAADLRFSIFDARFSIGRFKLPVSELLAGLLLVGLVGISGWVLWQHYNNPAYAKPDWRGVAQLIDQFSLPGDAILLTGDGGEKLFAYYYHGELPVYYDFNTPVPPPDQARQRLADMAATHRRLWFTPYGVDIDPVLEAWLAENAYPAWHRWLGRKRLALYGTQANLSRHETLNARFGEIIVLNHIDLPASAVAAGDLLPLQLTWTAAAPLDTDYQLSLRLINGRGDVFAQSDWPPLPPAAAWMPGQPLTDRRALWLPADIPPGDYLLQLVVYHPAEGQPLGEPATVTEIAVRAAEIVPPPQMLAIPNFNSNLKTQNLTLVGYAHPDSIQPGQELWLWLYWQADAPVLPEAVLRVALDGNDEVASTEMPLAELVGPLGSWRAGQVRRGVIHLPTSPRLTGDTAQLTVSLLEMGQPPAEFPLGQIGLENRPRNFEPPVINTPLDAAFGVPTQITLLGFNPDDAPSPLETQTLKLTLIWRAEADMETDYTVFVQLLNPAGAVAAQIDTQPQNGAAPTRTWLPGEILTETYTLSLPPDLPPGQYRLITGLYNAASGQRLPVEGDGDFVELQQITLQ